MRETSALPQTAATITLGNGSTIVFPAGAASVCDSTAGYGPTLWNTTCKPATDAITVNAFTYHDAKTAYDSGNHWGYRILKHFSGYTVLVN